MAESDDPEGADGAGELPATARERLADLVELQPTKNAELGERWGLESGSDVHSYLEGTLGEYYYRDEDSMIRATAEATELVGGEAMPTGVTPFEAALLSVLPGPDERSASVVATLHALRDAAAANGTGAGSADAVAGVDLGAVDAAGRSTATVRRALRALARKGLVSVVRRTVPTFRLKRAREELSVRLVEQDDDGDAAGREAAGAVGDDAAVGDEEAADDGSTVDELVDGALEGPEDGPSPGPSAR